MERTLEGRPGVGFLVQGFLLKTLWGRLTSLALAIGLLGVAFAQPAARPRREITLTAQSVPLSTAQPTLDRAGSAHFLGGLWLRSEDKGFGGLSGLTVEKDKSGLRIIAVTDEGDKFTARLVLKNAQLRGVEAATLEPLADLLGGPVSGKLLGDAESITRLTDGRVLVGFERRHRIWAYGPGLTGPATLFETPAVLSRAPSNGGLESMTSWPDGRILAITERLKTKAGNFEAFLFQGEAWTGLEWKGSGPGFEPTDATVLPNGDLLVLERFWSALAPQSLSSRIMRVKGDSVKTGALLQGELVAELKAPLIAENFEGIAAFRNAAGATQVVLVSDNNFNSIQRTLLLWFEMPQDQD